MPIENEAILIEPGEETLRLDLLLSKRFSGHFSRTYFQKLIEEGLVLLNGQPVKKRVKPKPGDEIEIEFAPLSPVDLAAENIPLDILFEDEDILVINKPAGLVVHPAPGNWTGTFVNALVYHCQELLKGFQEGSGIRPGIVHRLDKDTSGVLIAAKNSLSQRRLIESFASRQVVKQYLAVTVGNPGNLEITSPIGRDPFHRQKMAVVPTGKAARSLVETVFSGKELSLVRIGLETGRTHQIRVHLASIRTPVLGDSIYGKPSYNRLWMAPRQLLHAESLQITHPATNKTMNFSAPLPSDFEEILKKMGISSS
jgi:23S rRNA pseudouridine1911/1915/1917 synthase